MFSETCIQWNRVSDLLGTNFNLGAAVLNGKIYAVGGHRGYGGYLSEGEVYDPTINSPYGDWQWIANMHQARSYPAVVPYNDEIWAINGNCCGGPPVDSIEIYLPEENEWYWSYEKGVPFLGMPTINLNSAIVFNDKLYLIGGQVGNTISNAVKMWNGLSWEDQMPLPVELTLHSATVANEEIYVTGGYNNNGPGLWMNPFTFIYNPILNEWRTGPSVNIPRMWHTMVTKGHRIFMIGGEGNINGTWTVFDSVEILDLSAPNPTWKISECSKLTLPRYAHASVVLNNEIYVIGGNRYPNPDIESLSLVEKGVLSNECPVAEAGPDLIISCDEQVITTINGLGIDPDNDTLTCRWLKEETELTPWRSVGLNGECPLDLSVLPPFFLGQHMLKLEVSDGECTSADEMILAVVDNTPPTITAPSPVTKPTEPSASLCGVVISDAELGTPNVSDNCSGVTYSRTGVPSGNFFPVGTTTITYTALDLAGNTTTATQTVSVIDNTPPKLTLPNNIINPTDPGQCSAVVSYTVTATDNCPGMPPIIIDPPPGSVFPKGTTTVIVKATDASRNTATGTFTVTVEDKEPPKLVLPPNITKPTDPGQCSAVVNFTVTATDNCPEVTVVSNPPSGSVFAKGVTTVSVTATDTSRNMATGTFTVTVVDKELPRITFPANIVMPADPGQCSAAVCFMVTATDNCPGVTVVSNPPSCSIFPKGITTVTSVATDASGNGATCTFTVTVEDKELPKIAAPPDLTRRIGVGSTMCGMVISDSELGTPIFIDNCPGVTVTRTGIPPGNFFPVGTTTITYTSNDAAGNEASATQTVTVIDDGPPTIINVEATPNPSPVNTPAILTATLRDSTTGNCRVVSAEYSLDGGVNWHPMSAQDGTFDSPTEIVTATIGPFSSAGVYNVCVRGKDASGNTGEKACILLAVYDPDGGFVTGGGWITSPPGAYSPDPSLTGKATFGFVSKYQKGANVPTGQTEFQFKVANLNFHSESYDWLVVAGPKAQYKGIGTINGIGDYGFMLTAIDGQINGGHGVDKFRIKILDKATDKIIYDNQMGASDTEDPTTALGGGSIVIHKE